MNSLHEILKVTHPNNPIADFERIADHILNKCILRVGNKSYRICSIEFYYQQEKHLDKAAHAHQRQLSCGEWYFHGSGLDITFGNETEYGGILIQAIKEIEEPFRFIAGPLKTVTTIFENFGAVSNRQISFGLDLFEHSEEEIISAPRVGLNQETVGESFDKGYRFLIFPKEAHARKIDIINHLVNSNKMTKNEAEARIYK
ncbi:MAG: 3-methyladenine DNA glycosylase Mpg [Cyclobacteriaceae bacterium]|jgi:3-methyladenine DNA glycosylase Mpg